MREPRPASRAPDAADRPRLAPGIALRREPFGGIAYSYRTRRLQLIRSSAAVELALRLDAGATLQDLAREAVASGSEEAEMAERRLRRLADTLRNRGILT